ncbi:MAG: hypothetical protein ACR2J8_01350, partial [Thermomicrobiales bacterium]
MTEATAGADALLAASRSESRHLSLLESIAVVILAIATVASAWCGFQSGRWNGEQARAYEQSSQFRVDAARADALTEETRTVDLVIYSNFLNADAQGDPELARRYQSRFQPPFADAYEAWLRLPEATRPQTPFDMPIYRASPEAATADAARAASQAAFQDALDASSHCDEFSLLTVAFAGVLFLAGIVST